ncbi:Chaperone protein DnaK [Acidisarcina polymorpha]|uniref:Chaperone protein DnaK n=1 Tax=Acidisarcina polymorpha TaxID=2211140 RepID=A0A2Z5G8T6_9BACT|nr:Fe-S protein assembly chaperone HscA [Acidisarcina polymorpha]AXC15380.1 Chaperone protein DnaK [Acidisarcina polymorpha]
MAEERVIGIDLGTTNSLVAYMQGAEPVVIPGEDGSSLVPSVVAIPQRDSAEASTQRVIVGNGAARYLASAPERVVYSAKRLMGRGLEDIQEELKLFPFHLAANMQPGEVLRLRVGENDYTPSEISAFVLRQLKRNAERYFGEPVSKAVVTVPAYFNDAQRQATKDAGRMAGLDILRLVNEPTAAALAYGLDRQHDGIVAVYDLGGGTFDISILKLHEGIFEVMATNGDTHLGGDDIDNLLIAIALDDIHGEQEIDLRGSGEAVQAIRKAVIEAKIALSTHDAALLNVELPGGARYQRKIERSQFELLIQPVLDRTADPCRQALKDAGISAEQIDEVVLVGGSTRIPRVRALTDELFGLSARGKKPHIELNPDEVVALGAAVQANILSRGSQATENMLLLDVTPLSLGIEALGGVVAKVIQRNSTIPASATEHFTTGVEGQTNVAIHVVQGERELAKDCRSLARFDLKGIPPMSAGLPRIEVKFLIDANGILQVSAREQRSGKQAEIEVKPTYGLTDEQVESMILESFDYAESDIEQRQLIEARNEANTILAAVAKAPMQSAWEQLTTEEREQIFLLRDELSVLKDGDDFKLIQAAVSALDRATHRFAELMMDSTVAYALHGKTMEAAGSGLGEGPTAPHPFGKAQFE